LAFRISLAGWSLNRRFRRQENPLALLDFPRVVKEEFGIGAVELNSPFFAAKDEAYLSDLKAAAQEAGVVLAGMAVDGTGNASALDEAERRASVEKAKEWFPVAKSLDLPNFRINTGGHGHEADPEALKQCIKSFKELAAEAEAYGVRIVIENHWGVSADPQNIVRIIEEVGSDHLGTLPDFGNFPDESFKPEVLAAIRPQLPKDLPTSEIRYWGLELLAPYAFGAHAKMREFDADGNDTAIDVYRCVRILKNAGFDGWFGIEYEGRDDDHEGVLKSKALLERALAQA